jgi:hypothetical protein
VVVCLALYLARICCRQFGFTTSMNHSIWPRVVRHKNKINWFVVYCWLLLKSIKNRLALIVLSFNKTMNSVVSSDLFVHRIT